MYVSVSILTFISIFSTGIIINGGSKPNIIPEESTMEFYVRAPSMDELDLLSEKAKACFEGAASATGCKVWYFCSVDNIGKHGCFN